MPQDINNNEIYQKLFSTFNSDILVEGIIDGNLKIKIPEKQQETFLSLFTNPQKMREYFFHAVPKEKNTKYSKVKTSPNDLQASPIEYLKKIATEQYLNSLGLKLDDWKIISHNANDLTLTIQVKHGDKILQSQFENNLRFIDSTFFSQLKINKEIIEARLSEYPNEYVALEKIILQSEHTNDLVTELSFNYGKLKLALEECDGSSAPIIAKDGEYFLLNPMCLIRFLSTTFNDIMLDNQCGEAQVIMFKDDQYDNDTKTVSVQKTTIIVDISDSMKYENRLKQSQEVICNISKDLIDIAEKANCDWEINFVAFNDQIYKKGFSFKNGDSINSIGNFINTLKPDGQTNFYGALYSAIEDAIPADDSSNTFLIFSDGEDNINTENNPNAVSLKEINDISKNSNNAVFSLAIGQDLDALETFTKSTGGIYINDVYKGFDQIIQYIKNSHSNRSIVKVIDLMEPDQIKFKEILTEFIHVANEKLRPGDVIEINGKQAVIDRISLQKTDSTIISALANWNPISKFLDWGFKGIAWFTGVNTTEEAQEYLKLTSHHHNVDNHNSIDIHIFDNIHPASGHSNFYLAGDCAQDICYLD